ncbi:hypothetical protein [uncultured Brevibacillus sp.]|uniref:DUF4760 domain-containing protein n=1 Tax=uncultured Brevibacillus sp. TaxID=169970 RepID=UPI002599031E|nr:hypothetical protein [uncultured Brevibacillus sp.]
MAAWEITKEIVGFLYQLSGIIIVIGVVVGILQLRVLKKDLKDRNTRAVAEKSLEYLTFYANFIGEQDKYNEALKKEIPTPEKTDHLFDGKFNLQIDSLSKELLAESIVKYELGLHLLFNQLEYFSVAVLKGVVDDTIMYTPVAKNFCKLVKEEHVFISVMRSNGAPFKNLFQLYKKWTDRMEVEQLELQKLEAERKIKQKGTDYQSTPPIGF